MQKINKLQIIKTINGLIFIPVLGPTWLKSKPYGFDFSIVTENKNGYS